MTNNNVQRESNNFKSLHDLYGVKHLRKTPYMDKTEMKRGRFSIHKIKAQRKLNIPESCDTCSLVYLLDTGNNNKMHFYSTLGFPGDSVVKNLPTNAGDPGSIPGSGRSPGVGNGNPPQYSCLENPTDRGA